jgi:hypothetical protein
MKMLLPVDGSGCTKRMPRSVATGVLARCRVPVLLAS